MNDARTPATGIWRRFLILIPVVIVLACISCMYVRSVGGTFVAEDAFLCESIAITTTDIVFDRPGIVEVDSIEMIEGNQIRVVFRALGDGEVVASYTDEIKALVQSQGEDGFPARERWDLRVFGGVIIEDGVNFSGWESVHVCTCVLLAVVFVLLASVVYRLWRSSWYDYEMTAGMGGLLFCGVELVIFMLLWLSGGMGWSFESFLQNVCQTADWFVVLTFVPMAVLAVLVSLSNLVLIRREGMRPVNLLGIAVSLLWGGVCTVWLFIGDIIFGVFGSFALVSACDSLVSTAITFAECLLLSTMLCAWLASRHMPHEAADYLIILGCGIRKDGTPSPLLAGRVDKALAFDDNRTAEGDSPATFVPSGGQGPDEVMSEAQSMRDYLVQKHVPSERIILEDRSTSTSENMSLSREVIERHAGCGVHELNVAFSTTNYHVFRGYVCAHQAGMRVEGMGSKTRAYFWPNAFLREFAGLLFAQWKTILQVYLVFAIVYGIAEVTMLF